MTNETVEVATSFDKLSPGENYLMVVNGYIRGEEGPEKEFRFSTGELLFI